jgi:hypothetical protein
MRARHVLRCAGLCVLLASTARAGDGGIGLFFDPSGRKCAEAIPCAGFGKLYVYALLEGASAHGLTGAEYSINIGSNGGPDRGWTFAETFPADAIVLGRAFDPPDVNDVIQPQYRRRGVNVAFAECQRGTGQRVLLETVDVANSGCSQGPLPLLSVLHDNPKNERFRCLLFTLCDAPSYTKLCLGVSSGGAIINPQPGQSAPCPGVAVEPQTWSGIKAMYGTKTNVLR